jgi:hypothetical protein
MTYATLFSNISYIPPIVYLLWYYPAMMSFIPFLGWFDRKLQDYNFRYIKSIYKLS